MALYSKRAVFLIVPGIGTIKITPRGGREVAYALPEGVTAMDRKGRPVVERKKKNEQP